jgi:hypothetical protein
MLHRSSKLLGFSLVAMLAACSPSSATAPTTCPQGAFLSAVQEYVPDSRFIDTPWEPAEGTDLKAVIDSGGVACTYGLQEAEIGTTVMWARGADLYSSRENQWERDGYLRVDIDGTETAWALMDEAGEETHLWILNLLVDDIWIQINATFLRDVTAADDLIAAAIAATRG